MPSIPLTRFVLIDTSHAGNVGAAARALKVMGFHDLVLVNPRWPNVTHKAEAIALASGALDVLERTRIVATLAEALDGIGHVCATAMTPRDFGPPTLSPRAHLEDIAAAAPDIAFVFGSERFGLANDDVYAHVCLSIPTARPTARSTWRKRCSWSPTNGARRWAASLCSPASPRRRWPMRGRCRACSNTGSARWSRSAI